MLHTPLLADLATDLPQAVRLQRLVAHLRDRFHCGAVALLQLEEDHLRPVAVEGLVREALGRRFAVSQHPRLAAILARTDVTWFHHDSTLPDPYDGLLDTLVGRLAPRGEIVLAGFYSKPLSFLFPPAFMREATLRIAAQWKKHDLLAVTTLVESGALSLEGLITHTFDPGRAREAYERRVFVIGATGTIGQATVRALLRQGHEVVCFVRPRAGVGGQLSLGDSKKLLRGATVRVGNVCDSASLAADGFCGERFDVLLSCLASRTGTPKDAWAIDHR
eukprot:gene38337-50322_t